jgi:enamine deaminase RidA (YjgF/YER057c/UK114 family)
VSQRYRDGGGFEAAAAYSRAARAGSRIVVSGTADIDGNGQVGHPGDTYGQTLASLERAVAAVRELGGRREDVVRTRIYLVPDAEWAGAVKAHREVLEGVDPASTTLFVAGFIPEGVLVEVEVDAEVA